MNRLEQKLKFFTLESALTSIFLFFLMGCSTAIKKDRKFADDSLNPQSAFEAYTILQDSSTSFAAKALFVTEDTQVGELGAGVTFGGEKEGSSGLITRIMGVNSEYLWERIRGLNEESRAIFLKDFLSNYLKNANGYRTYLKDGRRLDLASDVVDSEGNPKIIDLSQLTGIDYENLSLGELEEKFKIWLDQTERRPFSFIRPTTRRKLFSGSLPGLSKSFLFVEESWWRYPSMKSSDVWRPNFGLAQRYIEDMHGTSVGWEIGFTPQKSYGEFEEMIAWFRNELKQTVWDPAKRESSVKLFQAPGHQRMVFTIHDQLPETKLAELYKMIQAYIIVRGISGGTGIESARFKKVHSDSSLGSLYTDRGVIRLEKSRWTNNDNTTHSIEFRAGTKDVDTYRFFNLVLASRVAANDFEGLATFDSWKLYEHELMGKEMIGQRFGVAPEIVGQANDRIFKMMSLSFMIPYWGWTEENSPLLGRSKRELVKNLTRELIIQIAELDIQDPNLRANLKSLLQQWTKATKLDEDIKRYVTPKRGLDMAHDFLHFTPKEGTLEELADVSRQVDVNRIDLGIEYSGKLPVRLLAEGTEKLQDNKKAWIKTFIDLDSEERKALLKNIANDLLEGLGGGEGPTFLEERAGHGHGLDLAFEITDPKNQKWVVEWDGIGRSYTPEGQIILGSERGGSVELVTPKFVPAVDEMSAVYRAFEKNNILPGLKSGGGHINIDLAPFAGRPESLARLLAIFHEHRGIIALMFQHISRMHTSEPVEISDRLARSLAHFEGSEDELKKLLYDERYFNTRFGRKSRYIQFDLSAYFQDVIPAEFVTDDFDISNPSVPWRRQFRVDPKIRKGEFRMFNAPRDAVESALMIRLVRAMLFKSLNRRDELSGNIQRVDHRGYLANKARADQDLEKLCRDLGLNIDDYRPALVEGLAETESATRSIFFEPFEEKMARFPRQAGWGTADMARDEEIMSKNRQWVPGPADELNTVSSDERLEAAREAQRRRSSIVPVREVPGEFSRRESCANLLDVLL